MLLKQPGAPEDLLTALHPADDIVLVVSEMKAERLLRTVDPSADITNQGFVLLLRLFLGAVGGAGGRGAPSGRATTTRRCGRYPRDVASPLMAAVMFHHLEIKIGNYVPQ